MSSDESDIEIKSALTKKTKNKMPKSPSVDMLKNEDPKKISTKTMIKSALTDLRQPHSRKGVSIQAIKKYIQEKYNYDVERYNYIIKKYLKTAVESGIILQTKGIGASGSFRLVDVREKLEKKKKTISKENKDKEQKMKKMEEKMKKMEEKKKKLIKPKVLANDIKSKTDKKTKKSNDSKDDISKKATKNTKPLIEKTEKPKKEEIKKEKLNKMPNVKKTPAKKRAAAMMKRKSIGSIIKPPKMKPKAK